MRLPVFRNRDFPGSRILEKIELNDSVVLKF